MEARWRARGRRASAFVLRWLESSGKQVEETWELFCPGAYAHVEQARGFVLETLGGFGVNLGWSMLFVYIKI